MISWNGPNRLATRLISASPLKDAKSQIAKMKPWALALSVALGTTASLAVTPAVAAETKALELVQMHYTGGRQKLYVTKDAIRLEHENSGVIVISKSPFTECFLINQAKRTCVRRVTSKVVKQLRQTQLLLLANDPMSEEAWSKSEAAKFAGLDTLTYSRSSPKKSWCKVWILKQPSLPDSAVDLICAFSSSFPAMHGAPLRMQQYFSLADSPREEYEESGDRKPFFMFETKSNKMVSVNDSLFEAPKGFARPSAKTNDETKDTAQVKAGKDFMLEPDFMFQSDKHKLEGKQRPRK